MSEAFIYVQPCLEPAKPSGYVDASTFWHQRWPVSPPPFRVTGPVPRTQTNNPQDLAPIWQPPTTQGYTLLSGNVPRVRVHDEPWLTHKLKRPYGACCAFIKRVKIGTKIRTGAVASFVILVREIGVALKTVWTSAIRAIH